MSRDADKHIRVTEETWRELNIRKQPGDSFDDVLRRLLDEDTDSRPESDI
jgi:predicted CopG family antitoxin